MQLLSAMVILNLLVPVCLMWYMNFCSSVMCYYTLHTSLQLAENKAMKGLDSAW